MTATAEPERGAIVDNSSGVPFMPMTSTVEYQASIHVAVTLYGAGVSALHL